MREARPALHIECSGRILRILRVDTWLQGFWRLMDARWLDYALPLDDMGSDTSVARNMYCQGCLRGLLCQTSGDTSNARAVVSIGAEE